MHRTVAAALVAALALAVASCGGSEPKLTRAELAKRVEVACREGQQQLGRHVRNASASARRSGRALLDAIIADQHYVIDRVDGLNVADAMQPDLDALKQGMQERVDLVKKLKPKDDASLQRAMDALQRPVEVVTARVQAAARRLGVQGCF
jgi:hypothetical protein